MNTTEPSGLRVGVRRRDCGLSTTGRWRQEGFQGLSVLPNVEQQEQGDFSGLLKAAMKEIPEGGMGPGWEPIHACARSAWSQLATRPLGASRRPLDRRKPFRRRGARSTAFGGERISGCATKPRLISNPALGRELGGDGLAQRHQGHPGA